MNNTSKSIRQFKNSDEIIEFLENERKLVFVDDDSKEIFKEYLNQYGYFSFVKKLSNDLMYEDVQNKVYKKEMTSNNVRYVFDIDRHIAIIVFKYFKSVEFRFNSSILKWISKSLNKYAKCPYIGALNVEDFDKLFANLDEGISKAKKYKNSNLFTLYNELFKNFNSDDYDCRYAIKQNKENENNEIKKIINNGWYKNFIYNNSKNIPLKSDWEYLDVFSLFQIINFSQLKRIFLFLSQSSQNSVINHFFNLYKPKNKYLKLKNESFIFLIEQLSNLRNILMHNGSMIKFKGVFKEDQDNIKKNLEEYFDIKFEDNEIKLNEMIKIIEIIIDINNKIFDEINKNIYEKFQNRTNRIDGISKLIFDIIKIDSGIDIDVSNIEIK